MLRSLEHAAAAYLHRIGWLVTVLIVLSPKWGPPGDFYLGYPLRFYITQDDVAFERVRLLPLLCDILLIGTPTFLLVQGIIWVSGVLLRGWRARRFRA